MSNSLLFNPQRYQIKKKFLVIDLHQISAFISEDEDYNVAVLFKQCRKL